jgi:hypothetical protein
MYGARMSYRVIDENDRTVSIRNDHANASCDASLFAIELGGRYRVLDGDGRLLGVAEGNCFCQLAPRVAA